MPEGTAQAVSTHRANRSGNSLHDGTGEHQLGAEHVPGFRISVANARGDAPRPYSGTEGRPRPLEPSAPAIDDARVSFSGAVATRVGVIEPPKVGLGEGAATGLNEHLPRLFQRQPLSSQHLVYDSPLQTRENLQSSGRGDRYGHGNKLGGEVYRELAG
jgi:hypothetical protein